ncbi:MAG TPA: DUF3667 domain-containing protein [Sphingomonadaceae bacterium]|nr:DUF3667 domain-containing protein [Sphingomonadaceae bacterium]
MSVDEAAAAADAISGGVIARAVEPRAGEAHAGEMGHSHETACLNCGAALRGEFCHACGQKAHVHRTLTAFWHDLLHGVLHFEGKIWRTLPLLAWKPGDLTRRYVAGERARFVSPLALFLFSAFLTFAVFSWTGGPFGTMNDNVTVDGRNSIEEAVVDVESRVAALEKRRVEAIARGDAVVSIDADLKDAREELSMLRLVKQRGVTEATLIRASDDLGNAPGWIKDAYKKAKANPSLLIYKLQNNAYKYSWALIPISVPFVWLLFPFSRRFRMYDHAVFVTYSLCFMTLLLVVLSLIKMAGAGVAELAMTFIPPIHMYRQLRGAYRLRWWSALLRTALLLVFAMLAATLFTLMLVALGVLG